MNISRAEIFISVLFLFFAKQVDCNETNVEDRLKLNFCWTHNAHTALTCSDLQEISKNVTCIKETDGISCLKLLLNNKADFMIAEPEELMSVAMNETEDNQIVVTHELVDPCRKLSSSTTLRMVVVARKEIQNLKSPQKKRLCSSGFEWKNYIKYFEKSAVAQHCDPNKTLLENRISSLADQFESDCIVNVKNYDNEFYKKIMTKYNKLHSGCSKLLQHSIALNAKEAVKCLFGKQGNILWSTLTDVHGYFKYELDFNKASENFHFICPDGTTRNLSNPVPCVWFRVPWNNFIARRDIAAKVYEVLPLLHHQIFSIKLTNQNTLSRKAVNIHQITPNEYLNRQFPEFVYLNAISHCKLRRTINWCITTRIEARKCDSLSKAARVYGIEPLINCVQEPSREMCIESVKNKKSHIFVVNADETFQAKKKGLKPIAHLFSRDEALYNQTVAMIPETNFLSLKSLKDLENNIACFPTYRGAGWNTFIHLMGKLTGNKDWYCEDKEMVSNFFNEACVVNLSEQKSTFPINLYSFCSKLPDVIDTGDAEKKAWSCLDYGADVAFVTYKNESESDKLPLCINGDWKNSIFSPEECLLTQSAQASLMIHNETLQLREDEIRLMIQDLQRLFGTPFMRYKIFSLFGHFEGTAGIIFPKNTVRMELVQSRSSRKFSQEAILDEIEMQRKLCNKLNSEDDINDTHYSFVN